MFILQVFFNFYGVEDELDFNIIRNVGYVFYIKFFQFFGVVFGDDFVGGVVQFFYVYLEVVF